MKTNGLIQDKQICNALMKQSLTLIDKCLNKQKRLQLKIQNEMDALNDLAWE